MEIKRKIRIAYVDMWTGFQSDVFPLERILKSRFEIIHDENNPDFVICGPFGQDYLNYDCIRVLYLGEALSPDFNVYDYAIGFDYLEFSDRYLRMPIYMFDTEAVRQAETKHLLPDDFYLKKTKFCNFVVSNKNAMPVREEFFKALDARRHVDSAGGYLNNMPNGERCGHLVDFRRPYKFTLAFENSLMDGYITEKILYAMAAGTVPIYYGGNLVEKEFNPEAFIDVSKFNSYGDCIDYILYLDNNSEEYLKIAKQPAFLNQETKQFEGLFLDFIDKIVSKPNDDYRRLSKKKIYGKMYEERLQKSKSLMENKRKRILFWK